MRLLCLSLSHFSLSLSSFSIFFNCFFFISPAFSYASSLMAASFCASIDAISLSRFLIASGFKYTPSLVLDAASSIRSIALSGRNLSLIYLNDILTAATSAASEIFTPWCFSYAGLIPFNISTVSSSEGSSTLTG